MRCSRRGTQVLRGSGGHPRHLRALGRASERATRAATSLARKMRHPAVNRRCGANPAAHASTRVDDTAAASNPMRQDPRAENYPMSGPAPEDPTHAFFFGREGPRLRDPTPPPTEPGNDQTFAVIPLHATPAKITWWVGGSGRACEVHEPGPKYRAQHKHGAPSELPHGLGTGPAIQQCGGEYGGLETAHRSAVDRHGTCAQNVQSRPPLGRLLVAPGLLLTASRQPPGSNSR